MRLPRCAALFADGSYDVVLLIDIIEHLEKKDGDVLLAHAERIARRAVFVVTPDGFSEQDGWDAWGLGHNELQAHVCGWSERELANRGYNLTCRVKQSGGPVMALVKEF